MPGLLDDIITDHAGTVMGGSHERSGPCTPFRQRHFKFGKSLSQRSNTNSGAAQSSPISMTRGRASPGAARKAASRVDSGEYRSFKSLRYQGDERTVVALSLNEDRVACSAGCSVEKG